MIYYGGSVFLDTLDVISAESLRTWRNDYEIRRFCRQNDLIPKEAHLDWYIRQLLPNSKEKMYAVCRRSDRKAVGVCGLTHIDFINRNAEFSLYIATEHQKSGLGTAALKALVTHGFMAYGLEVIWGESYANNPARSMFKKIGFSEDGIRRSFYFREGTFVDAYLYSLLKSEWEISESFKEARALQCSL